MGIKDLWNVIAPAKRCYSLEEICSKHRIQNNGRPLRMAVDVALWSFQAQSSVGGARPQLRLMFLRFCRLYELGIRPIFVFDGPHRPTFKRDRVISTTTVDSEFSGALRELIRIFDFFVWDARGEAEAECAMLERLGFVDMIMTGDVDVFLFGGRRLMRHWVQRSLDKGEFYDMAWINDTTGLDRSDLILIALLRGNDYDHGSERIGIRVAEELARRKKHRPLMETVQERKNNSNSSSRNNLRYDDDDNDDDGDERELEDQLRQDLEYHLRTGCHGKLQKYVDMDLSQFPERHILHDFINPHTNIATRAARELTSWLAQFPMPDLQALALFCKEAFEWRPDYIVKRFKNLLFLGYVQHRLRTMALGHPSDALSQRSSSRPSSQGAKRKRDSQSQDIRSFFSVTGGQRTRATSSSSHKAAHVNKSTIINIGDSDRSDEKEDILGIRFYKKEQSLELFYVDVSEHVMDAFVILVKSRLDEQNVFSFSDKFLTSSQPPQNKIIENMGNPGDESLLLDEQDEEDEGHNEREKKSHERLRRWMPIDVIQMAYPKMVQAYLDSRTDKPSNKSASSSKHNQRRTSTPKRRRRNKEISIDNTQRLLTEFINADTNNQDVILIE